MVTLGLEEWKTGFPLAAIGIGIGVGSLAAGRLSASKVEYGLVPLGALGLTLSTLAFALIGPGLAGTILLMGLIGFSAAWCSCRSTRSSSGGRRRTGAGR